MIFGYARVSTKGQSLQAQLDELQQAGCEEIFSDVASGGKTSRPGFNELLGKLRKGDTLKVCRIDRVGRSLSHLVKIINEFEAQGIQFQSLADPIDTTTSHGRLIFGIFACIAEYEKSLIQERTKSGLAAARARGRTGGRPKGVSKTALNKALAAESLYSDGKLSVSQICEQLAISKSTLYNYLRHRGIKIGA